MKKKWILYVLGAIVLAVAGYFGYNHLCTECFKLDYFKPENIKAWIQGFGSLGIAVFIGLYALNTVVLLPPIAVMSLSAGVLFGPLWGGVAIMAGSFLGTTATFFISRFFGEKWVSRFLKGEKAGQFQEQLSKRGFFVILPMRLIGFPPWEVVNYVSGLSKMKYRDYIAATMIGILPAAFAQSFLSDRISSFNWKDPTLYIAIVAFIAVGAIATFVAKKMGATAPTKESEQADG